MSTRRLVSVTDRLRARRRMASAIDSSSSDEEESDDEAQQSGGFCTPHLCIAIFMMLSSGAIWAGAAYLGIVQGPSERLEAIHNHSRARLWPWQTRTALNSFAAFDHDNDGFFSDRDLTHLMPKATAAERKKYLGLADTDGDGKLNEAEYVALVHRERAHRAAQEGRADPPA
jgi:hypothetical protein